MCILRFYELVVKINVVHLSFLEMYHWEQGTYQQGVERVCRVEVVGLARWGRIGDVLNGKLPDSPEDGIRATGPECRMQGKMTHEMCGYILYTRPSAKVDAHERTDDFTILISKGAASYAKRRVDYWWQFGIKLLHNWKYSAEGSEFCWFYAYICHAIDEFHLLYFATLS